MKIISYNIGIKIDNAKAVAEYLKAENADIICLQEVMRALEDSVFSLYSSEKIIREYLKNNYPYYFFAPEWTANKLTETNGPKNKDLGGMAEQGKLVLSKYPIVHGYNYFYYKNYEFDCDRTDFYKGNDHGRAFQVCEININGQIIQVGNVHGCHSVEKLDTERSLMQSNFIIEKLKQKQTPTILLGDFNVLQNTKSIEIISKEYNNLNSKFDIITTRPKGQIIDFVFINEGFLEKNLKVGITDISDHYPLIAEIELNKN